jgi:hypothetical protein
MDYFAFQISVTNPMDFSNWTHLEKHVKDTITKAGIISNWLHTIKSIKQIELTLHNNSMSSTYNLKTNTLTKMHRVPDADIVSKIYKDFINTNQNSVNYLKQLGIEFSEPIVEKNIQTDQDRVLQTLSTIPKFRSDSTSLLKNLIPLHTERTDYGIIYVRASYVEIWFNDGHIDFIRELDHKLYENIYYKIYKDNLINSDIIRFAFPRQYDYTPAPQYISLGCPDGTCGESCYQDIVNRRIDTAYLKLYIDQAVEVVTKWQTITTVFPDDPIRLENRVRDTRGYYFIFLGTHQDRSLIEFIDLQIEYISQLIDFLDSSSIDKDQVLTYARTLLM